MRGRRKLRLLFGLGLALLDDILFWSTRVVLWCLSLKVFASGVVSMLKSMNGRTAPVCFLLDQAVVLEGSTKSKSIRVFCK